jgi:hypothetical protein
MTTAVPHTAQNFAPSLTGEPHFEHDDTGPTDCVTGAPQPAQNFSFPLIKEPHLGQFINPPE